MEVASENQKNDLKDQEQPSEHKENEKQTESNDHNKVETTHINSNNSGSSHNTSPNLEKRNSSQTGMKQLSEDDVSDNTNEIWNLKKEIFQLQNSLKELQEVNSWFTLLRSLLIHFQNFHFFFQNLTSQKKKKIHMQQRAQDKILLDKIKVDQKRKECKERFLYGSFTTTSFAGHRGTIYSLKAENNYLVTGSAGNQMS